MDFHSSHQKSFSAVGEVLIVHRLTFSPVRICIVLQGKELI
jgi:hypothetical protein